MIFLKNRSIISVTGENYFNFLQSIISNDIKKINKNNAIYSFILNPQGRFLYEFFVFQIDNKIFIDCLKEKEDELIKKLNLYKIRQKIIIEKTELLSFASFSISTHQYSLMSYQDPRSKEMGFRFIFSGEKKPSILEGQDLYNKNRILLKIPDEQDLTYERSLVLDYGFDNLNAISYDKGCYVGQEPTARMHYRKISRRKIIAITDKKLRNIPFGTKILNGDIEVGNVLSSVFYDNVLYYMVKVKNDFKQEKMQIAEKL
jgi:folate-binding protein YgfZ